MNALMNTGDAPLTMSTRELAELCDKRHDHVLRDVEKMLSDLGQTSPQFWGELPDSYGRPQRVAFLPKRETLVLVSGYSAELRARIIDRWLELEAAATPKLPDLSDPNLLRGLLLDYSEKVLALQSTIEKQAPMVAFANAVADAEDLQKIAVVAKALGVGPRKLLNFMKDDGILMRDGLPFQHHLDAGRFRVVEVPYTDAQGNSRMRPATRVTAKGLTFLQQRVAKTRATQGA